jgi:class 3 adenylate cyclase/tetratricopeptide (TPR) repeat protein
MKCLACKSDNLDAAGFCNQCGGPMEARCAACGQVNPQDSKFCNQCGQPLGGHRSALRPQERPPLAYTPNFLADKILTRRASIEGERKRVTVLFADVAGFTAMSEQLDPEEMHEIMDGCFTILMDEIHKYEGTINQFTGDGVMALFGAPLAHEDHAQRACYAALDIQHALQDYRRKIQQRYGVAFNMRVGLNSGPVVVGAIGDDLRMDYTAIGNTTNLSARMESLAEPGTIRVSRNTYRMVRDYFDFEALGTTLVKGKAEPLETYELKGSSRLTSRLEASARLGLTAYAGRRKEQAALENGLAKACAGHGQVVGISGEAGVGKSRLIYELRRSLGGGIAYFEGRCVQFGKTIAFMPFKDILRGMLNVGDGDSPSSLARKIKTHYERIGLENDNALAVCQDLFGASVSSERWKAFLPKERKELAFGVLRELFMHAGRENPLVLVVDDLHWVDKTSEEFLDYLIEGVHGASVLVVLIYRPEYHHARMDHPGYHEIPLTQLPEETGAELIESILDNAAVAPDLIRFVLDRSDGNPLFIEELSRTLVENGGIRWASDRYVLDRRADAANVPENIHGIIAARMDSLEDDVKRVAQLAAVIGRDFTRRVLQTVTGMKEQLDVCLEHLQALEFIYRKHRYPEPAYTFKHVLTQEVAYKSLLRQKRARYHLQVAGAIEQLYAQRLEESYDVLAYHYDRSENAQKAYEYLRLSGEKAIRTHFLWEAYSYFKKALGALDRLPHGDRRHQQQLEILHLMVIPIIALGLPEDSLAFLERGVRVSTALDDHVSMTRFYSNIGVFHMSRGNYDQGSTYTRRAFETAERMEDVDAMAQSGPDLCQDFMNAGKFEQTVQVATRIIDAVEKAGRESDYFGGMTNIYSVVKAFIGYSRGVMGDFTNGLIIGEKALAYAVRFGGPETIGVSEVQLGSLHLLKGSHGLALNFIRDGLRHLEEANFYWQIPWGRSMFGLAQTFHGNPQSGRVHIEKALAENQELGIEWRRSVMLFNLGVCRFFLAAYQPAVQAMKQAHALAVESGQRYVAGKALTWLGRIESRLGPQLYAAASEHICKGIDMLGDLDILPELALGHLFLGEVYARSGDKGLSAEHVSRARQMFQDVGMHIQRRIR